METKGRGKIFDTAGRLPLTVKEKANAMVDLTVIIEALKVANRPCPKQYSLSHWHGYREGLVKLRNRLQFLIKMGWENEAERAAAYARIEGNGGDAAAPAPPDARGMVAVFVVQRDPVRPAHQTPEILPRELGA